MAIAVSCRCGKKFKVKDRMAGKKVRCPHCKGPLRIPGPGGASAASAGPAQGDKGRSETSKKDQEEAILRFEEGQKRKLMDAEAEAARREERNKLIESYDQIAGKTGKAKKKKSELAPGKRRKPSIFIKVADAFGIIRATLVFKYVFVIVLFSAGVVGSIYLVQFVYTYMGKETESAGPVEQQVDELFEQAEAAIGARQWGKASEALAEILRLQPRYEKHRRYIQLKKKLEEEFDKG